MELFLFRNVRPIQSQPSDGLDITTMFEPPLDVQELQKAADDLANQPPSDDVTEILGWLNKFSSELALLSDLLSPRECIDLLPGNWREQVGSQAWTDLGHNLALTLINAMRQESPSAPAVELLCRQLLVFGLVATLASDEARPEDERTLKTATGVQAMVTWRHVILPSDFYPKPTDTPLLARRPGFTDLYVVHDEWNHYEAGELAAVVNVLPGETFENQIRHSQKVDTLTSTTTVTTTSQLTEQQQTTSSSLSQTSTSAASQNIGAQAQVQISGQYGPVSVSTSLGAQSQSSQSESDTKALTTAYQTVQQAVKSVTQQVTTVQSQRTITRESTYDDHKLQNTGKEVIVGMYRWLTEVHYVQMLKYPNRFVLEFEVPEPGAWLRWALQNTSTADWDHPDPGPFTMPDSTDPVSPGLINKSNYVKLAAQWQVQGLTPPPPGLVILSVSLTADPPQSGSESRVLLASDNSLSVPAGYEAMDWTAQMVARLYPSQHIVAHDAAAADPIPAQDFDIVVSVGGPEGAPCRLKTNPDAVPPPTDLVDDSINGSLAGTCTSAAGDGLKSGTIPITVYAYDYFIGFSCVVNVNCQLLPETYAEWQETTFDQLAAAYQALLNAFHLERDTRNQQAGGLSLAGPPELNQSRAVNELRRTVIQDLRGVLMNGDDSPVLTDGKTLPFAQGEPYVPVGQPTAEETNLIQFFEQVLEWENLVYICYPYYWARHDQWITDTTSASADPVFDQFLNAGSARVVVPARPGFENLVLFYLYTGLIWGGSQPPAPNDPDYLSIAQEIQALEQGATDGAPSGSSWEIKLPTTLLWAGTDPGTLPTNPNPTIPPPSQT